MKSTRNSFTLIELLIVVAALAILTSFILLALPGMNTPRSKLRGIWTNSHPMPNTHTPRRSRAARWHEGYWTREKVTCPVTFMPSYDLWSTAGKNDAASATTGIWIGNWPQP